MTILDIAAMLVAVAVAVVAGYLVPLLIQFRRTLAESEQLLLKMNVEAPLLVAELRAMSQNLNEATTQARGGVEHAAVLLHAMGEIGESVQQVHDVVRGSSGNLVTNAVSLMAGFKAITQAVRARMNHKGDSHNGG
jgi:uncharacterized protein YoxC